MVRGCADGVWLDGDGLDGLFDHRSDEPVEVEDEFFAVDGSVVQEGVDACRLAALGEDGDLFG